jgi:NADH dehydrogenase (ubiquinone) Fe-S protein 5
VEFVSQCYATADEPKQCQAQAADYYECLHGRKRVRHQACNVVATYSLCPSFAMQALREKKIRQELLRQLNADGKEAQKAAEILASGPVAGVGLRDKA